MHNHPKVSDTLQNSCSIRSWQFWDVMHWSIKYLILPNIKRFLTRWTHWGFSCTMRITRANVFFLYALKYEFVRNFLDWLTGVRNMRYKLHKNIDDRRLYQNLKIASYHWSFFVSWNIRCYCRLNTWGNRPYGKLFNWKGATATIKTKIAYTDTPTKRRNCTSRTSRWFDRVHSLGGSL